MGKQYSCVGICFSLQLIECFSSHWTVFIEGFQDDYVLSPSCLLHHKRCKEILMLYLFSGLQQPK